MPLRTKFAAQIAFERGGLIGLATLVVYIAVAPAHVVDGEHAHFATLGALGGAAHPSGYPLYVLWLRAMSWLPGANPAHTAAIATAVLGAGAVVALHAACRAWGARVTAASVAVAVFAGAPLVLAIDTEPEVFALNNLVVALVLWLAAVAGPVRGHVRCALLGLVAGLGLSNHMTCALVAPVGILGVVRGVRETSGSKVVAGALAAAGLVVGLLPYIYLAIAPVHAGSWGRLDSPGAIVDLILRRDYGGPGAFAATGDPVPITTSLAALIHTLGRTWLWAPAVLGLIELGVRCVRPTGPESRWGWAMLATSFVLAGPLLVSRFNVAPEGVGHYIVARFHLVAALLLAIPIAAGFDRLGRRFATRSVMLGGVVSVCVLTAAVVTSLPHLLRVHAPAVEYEARNVLATLPPAAVVIGESDDLAAGITYAQLVLGERPDVAYVHWPMMKLAWARDRLAPHDISIDATGGTISSARLVTALFASGRPVFIEPSKLAALGGFPHYPYGILVRLLPPGTRPPSLHDVVEINRRVYAAFTFGYELPGTDDEWPTAVHLRYAATWETLGRALEAAGEHDDAAWAFGAARAIGPQP